MGCSSPFCLIELIEIDVALGKKLEQYECHNPSLGITTKTRVYKGVGQESSSRITFHVPGSVGKCEGINPHTLK